MAINKKISDLNEYYVAAATDVFALVDVGSSETKKIEVSDLMASPGPIGDSNPDTGVFSDLTVNGDLSVGGYAIDTITNDPTLSGASNTAVPTEEAVKTYVDTAVAGIVVLDVIHISSDSTATIGNSLLVDTASGVVNVELIPDGNEGKIDIKKVTTDSNIVHLYTSGGALIDGQSTNDDLNIGYGNISLLCDGTNFYII